MQARNYNGCRPTEASDIQAISCEKNTSAKQLQRMWSTTNQKCGLNEMIVMPRAMAVIDASGFKHTKANGLDGCNSDRPYLSDCLMATEFWPL